MNDTATYTTKGKPFERDMSYLPDRVLAGARSADPLDDQFPSGSKDSPRDVPVWDAEPAAYEQRLGAFLDDVQDRLHLDGDPADALFEHPEGRFPRVGR